MTDATTTDRELSIYHKLASSSTYPANPSATKTLTGDSGTDSITLADLGDSAFDFKVVFYDGTSYFTAYPSVASNVRLVTIDTSGNVEVSGNIRTAGDIATVNHHFDNPATSHSGDSYLAWSVRDPNYKATMFMQAAEYANGMNSATFAARKEVNGSNVDNVLKLNVTNNGTRTVSVSDAAAWRSALELGTTAPGTILWSGTLYMTGGHTANLSHNISTCPSGILLHWQPYSSSTVQNWGHEFTFIPKTQHNGAGCMARLATSKFGVVGTKYVYVSDDKITGNNDNNASGTANGIKYTNGYWVLTQVIAV